MTPVSVWEYIDVNSFNLKYGTLKSVALTRGGSNPYGSALMVSFQGDIIALGENKNGCLGLELDNTKEAVKVQGLSLVSGVSVCHEFGDGLAYTREGKLYVWGANVDGNTCRKPVLIENLPKIVDAKCIQGHYLVLTDNGKVYEWRGTETWENRLNTLSTTPTAVVLKDDIVGIACGLHHSLAVTKHGDVYSFGVKYVVSSGTFSKQEVTKISLPGETVAKVACGLAHSLALTQSGKVYTWGCNDYYLGDDGGQIDESDTPLQVGGKIGRFVDIATSGCRTNAAVTDSGAVYMWGCNDKRCTVKTPTLTQHTELQQVFSNISPSYCSWTYKDSYSVSHEDPALLGMEMAATFNVEDLSDLTLLVGNKAIYVHKYVLKLRSEFFRTWLQERWTDKSKRQLELTCYDYDVYLSYLWFLYSGEIKTSPQHILELWDLAVAYGEEKLKLGCENLISQNMTTTTLLHLRSRTSSRSLSEIENVNCKPLEDKINEIKEDYESQCKTLKKECTKALEKLKNEYKPTEGKDASQYAKLSALLESEDLKTEQAPIASDLELEVVKLKEDLTKLGEKYIELETENLELRKFRSKLEEDNLKLKKVNSTLKSDHHDTKMVSTELEGIYTTLQEYKIPTDDGTNLEAAHSEIAEVQTEETRDVGYAELVQLGTTEEKDAVEEHVDKLETDQFTMKVIHTKTQTSYTRIKDDKKRENDDLDAMKIHGTKKRRRKEEKDAVEELKTDQFTMKVIHAKTQSSYTTIKGDDDVDIKDLEAVEIHGKEERLYEKLKEDYTELDMRYRKLEKEKANLEEENSRLQEKHKRLRDLLTSPE